jgi:hypothetical protein
MVFLFLVVAGVSSRAGAQACSSGTGTVTGTVYAPNGTDPLPNVTVYIPTAPPAGFTPGVSCPMVGAPPSNASAVGAETDVNGHFELDGVPAGTTQVVIVSGRWRRVLAIPAVNACQTYAVPASIAVMPSNQLQGDIPKIAIATGSADQVECVLLKMGIAQSEFTDPTGSGRINLFGGGAPGTGVTLDPATPTQASLMGNSSTLNGYDVLMLPCEGSNIAKPATELQNLVSFANSGGRVYSSHFSYSWMYQNPPFDTVANWLGNSSPGNPTPDPGTATVNISFTGGKTLAQWLQLPVINASTSPGQMQISTLRQNTAGVNPPTQAWLALNDAAAGNPVMQFVFDTPVAQPNQCGRVLYNEYHVENPTGPGGNVAPGTIFPNECTAGTTMTPQEKLLEYMLFELTDNGGQPTLVPLVQDFGAQAIGFTSPAQTFTWTNNSSFSSQVTSVAITAGSDFSIANNGCANVTVPGGGSCTIQVVFTPSALGASMGSLTVVAQGNTQTAQLTGTGTPGFILSEGSLTFGSLDVTGHATQTLTLTNIASGPLAVPQFVTTGQFGVAQSGCPGSLAAGKSCMIQVSFLPTSIGDQGGTVGVNSTSMLYDGVDATLTGIGVDFTIGVTPTSGSVVAGDGTTATATFTPLAGFAEPLTLTCAVQGGTGTACTVSANSVTPTVVSTVTVSMTTTSQYAIVGYGGFGGRGYLWLVGLGSGCLLWRRRRSVLRSGLLLVVVAALGLSLTGCTGKEPAQNTVFTGPGTYMVTVTATDGPAGFLTHSATYTLTVTAK